MLNVRLLNATVAGPAFDIVNGVTVVEGWWTAKQVVRSARDVFCLLLSTQRTGIPHLPFRSPRMWGAVRLAEKIETRIGGWAAIRVSGECGWGDPHFSQCYGLNASR